MKGYHVILKEINDQLLQAGVERIAGTVSDFLKRRKLPAIGIEQVLRNFTPQTSYADFDKCDLVIEAVIENVPLKQKIFAELEKVCSPQCILATNTSTIDIDLVGKLTKAQDRILGLHFFSPAHVMPLLEIVRTERTSAQTLATCVASAKQVGKTPVVVGNCVGFTANRMFFPYGQAASMLVDLGVDPYAVDKAILAYGMPMGPFQVPALLLPSCPAFGCLTCGC
jgi:enoyl-CoA hydratase/3-hydroxyacyl-CoA dehydrogenase